MILWVTLFLLGISVPTIMALTVFSLEIMAGLITLAICRRPAAPPPPPFVVLMPAHNEGKVLAATLAATRATLRPEDRILVVADNCDDDTATLARQGGAEVIERNDPEHRGKGYALAFGVAALRPQPPACVIVLDADCRPQGEALQRIAGRVARTGRPVQACYLMEPDAESGPVTRFSTFAFMIKNKVRQQGMAAMGGICVLSGSGMGFPWPLIEAAQLADGEIVEDLVLGVRQSLAGHAPLFLPDALILSSPAPSDRAAEAQRGRWERGFVSAARRFVPLLLASALRRARFAPAWFALHLLVPPLVLLFALALVVLLVDLGLAGLTGAPIWPGLMVALAMVVALASVAAAWLAVGRAYLKPGDLIGLPRYVLAKARIWSAGTRAAAPVWNRTDR